jgi:hypothetical protein
MDCMFPLHQSRLFALKARVAALKFKQRERTVRHLRARERTLQQQLKQVPSSSQIVIHDGQQ